MLRLITLLLSLALIVSAEFTFSRNSTITAGSICSRTYSRSLPCSQNLLSLFDIANESIRFSPSLLESSCTSECYNSLVQWTSDIRRDCSNGTIGVIDTRNSSGAFTLEKVLDPRAQWLETLWFDTCLTDLTVPGHQFCKTYNDTTNSLNYLYDPKLMHSLNDAAEFCKSSCAVQTGIYIHETNRNKTNVLDPRKVCSGLDTKPFPFPESWKQKDSPGWQQGGEGGRGANGPLEPSNDNSTGWQIGGEGGRPPVNESVANYTGWHQGGEGGRGLDPSLVNESTIGDLTATGGAAETRISLLAVVAMIGVIVVGL